MFVGRVVGGEGDGGRAVVARFAVPAARDFDAGGAGGVIALDFEYVEAVSERQFEGRRGFAVGRDAAGFFGLAAVVFFVAPVAVAVVPVPVALYAVQGPFEVVALLFAFVVDEGDLGVVVACFQGDVGRAARQQGFVFGGDGAAIRRGEGGHRPQCLRPGVKRAFQGEFDVAFAVFVGVGGGDALLVVGGDGFVVAADLPARPRRVGFGEVAFGDAPDAVVLQVGCGRAVEPVGFEVKACLVVAFSFDGEFALDLARHNAVHAVGFVNEARAVFAEAQADLPVAKAGVGGDVSAVAVGAAVVGFQQFAVDECAVRAADFQPKRAVAIGFAFRCFEQPQGVDGVFRAVNAAVVPAPVGEGAVGLGFAGEAFVGEVDFLSGHAQVGKVAVVLADEVAGGVGVFTAGLCGAEAGDALGVGFGFAEDAVVFGVEGDVLSGDGLVVTQVAQFGEQTVRGLVGGQSLVGDGEAQQRVFVLVFGAHGEDVHAAAGFFARHVGKGDAALYDAVARAFFGFKAACPDFAGVVVEVVGVEVFGVVDGVMRVAGEVVVRDLPQFEFDGIHVAAFDGQRRFRVKYQGFAAGGKAHHRRAVAGVDVAFFCLPQFEVVFRRQFRVNGYFVFALPDAGVADFVAAVARFAFGGRGDGDAFAPVLQRLGEDDIAEFGADLRFVLVVVHADVVKVKAKALAQVAVGLLLLFVQVGLDFGESCQGKGGVVAVIFHDGFVQREVVVQIGAHRVAHARRRGQQCKKADFFVIGCAGGDFCQQFAAVLQVGEVARLAFFAFAVFGVLAPGTDVGIGEAGDGAAAVAQILVNFRFCLLAGGGEGFCAPIGGVCEGNGANHGGK